MCLERNTTNLHTMFIEKAFETEWTKLWLKFVTSFCNGNNSMLANSNFTLEMILKYIENNNLTNWDALSQNPNLNKEFILGNLDKPWDWEELSAIANITTDDILNNLDKPWEWQQLCRNANITMDDILNNLDKPWDWLLLSCNTNITMDNVLNNLDKPWDWFALSSKETTTMEFISNNPNLPWDWLGINFNPNITIKFIDEHLYPNGQLRYGAISNTQCVAINDVLNNLDKQWDWFLLSQNKNITIEMILTYTTLPWNWLGACENPNVSIDDYKIFSEKLPQNVKYYFWHCLSQNDKLTMNDVLNNLDKPWNKVSISKLEFKEDKTIFILSKTKWLLLATLYENYNNFDNYDENTTYSNVEQILMNDYLVKYLVKF